MSVLKLSCAVCQMYLTKLVVLVKNSELQRSQKELLTVVIFIQINV